LEAPSRSQSTHCTCPQLVKHLETANRGCQSQRCYEPVHICKFRVFSQGSREVRFSVTSQTRRRVSVLNDAKDFRILFGILFGDRRNFPWILFGDRRNFP
jgi:hypothetical protein